MSIFWLALHLVLVTGFGLRILLRNDMRSDVRMGWLAVIVLVPYLSCVLYFLFGEVALGRHGSPKLPSVRAFAQQHGGAADPAFNAERPSGLATRWQAPFGYAASINGFAVQAGHQAELMADGASARARLLADLDAAQHSISVLYYIWLDDTTGTAVAHALMRAAQRGVVCHAMVDGLGSRALTHSQLWQAMTQAGVHTCVALPLRHMLRVLLRSRIDLRNHRKITLIDGHILHVGSQNCADEAFAVKAKYAPWVDIMLRMQGPAVTQMQLVFASDWSNAGGEASIPQDHEPTPVHRSGSTTRGALNATSSSASLGATQDASPAIPDTPSSTGFVAVTLAEGPTERPRSTPQLIASLLGSAQHSVTLSTPYFIPDVTVLDALCTAAWRGVAVTLILPARNDSWIVGAASRSTYWQLLNAGVQIHEFHPGLLHAKTLCVDDTLTLMGSTNLDLRSFDLNFENNVLLHDPTTTGAVRARQAQYIAQSSPVTLDAVRAWPWWQRVWHNLLATISPVL